MAAVDTDRNHLFGLLALQIGLIDQGQLVAAFGVWARDKARSLAEDVERWTADEPLTAWHEPCRGEPGLVMSGPGRMMYLCLEPKPEVAIFSKRSKPQGTNSSPHDTGASIANWLASNIQGAQVQSRTLRGGAAGDSPAP
jgi:hypothetical protein